MIQRSEPDSELLSENEQKTYDTPRRAATVIAIMEMGLSDFRQIADAVGITVDEVERIDLAEDRKIRNIATKGTPEGTYLPLNKAIRCPRCRQRITLVPCVSCAST